MACATQVARERLRVKLRNSVFRDTPIHHVYTRRRIHSAWCLCTSSYFLDLYWYRITSSQFTLQIYAQVLMYTLQELSLPTSSVQMKIYLAILLHTVFPQFLFE